MGIGLVLVKGLVEMHGGTVEAMGSTFIVRLPVLEHSSPSREQPAEFKEVKPIWRILIADDNSDSSTTLSTMLRMYGHETRTANDGLEAVRVAKEFHPQIILMDLGMPKMNGHEATRQIRFTPHGKQIKIYALTGWGQENDRIQSAQAGCDGHLVKPVDIKQLKLILDSLASE